MALNLLLFIITLCKTISPESPPFPERTVPWGTLYFQPIYNQILDSRSWILDLQMPSPKSGNNLFSIHYKQLTTRAAEGGNFTVFNLLFPAIALNGALIIPRRIHYAKIFLSFIPAFNGDSFLSCIFNRTGTT
jgi:hypothetical protein